MDYALAVSAKAGTNEFMEAVGLNISRAIPQVVAVNPRSDGRFSIFQLYPSNPRAETEKDLFFYDRYLIRPQYEPGNTIGHPISGDIDSTVNHILNLHVVRGTTVTCIISLAKALLFPLGHEEEMGIESAKLYGHVPIGNGSHVFRPSEIKNISYNQLATEATRKQKLFAGFARSAKKKTKDNLDSLMAELALVKRGFPLDASVINATYRHPEDIWAGRKNSKVSN